MTKPRIPKDAVCYLCGRERAKTWDHVPPRVMYPKSQALNNVEKLKIPCCGVCNEKMGLIDDEISTYFALGVFSDHRKEISERIGHKYRKDPKLREKLIGALVPLSSTNIPEVFHKEGATDAIKIPEDLISQFIIRLIKGLHTKQTELIIDDNFDIRFFDYSSEQLEKYRLNSKKYYHIDGVIDADAWLSTDGKMGLWWIEIYGNQNFIVIVAPKAVGIYK